MGSAQSSTSSFIIASVPNQPSLTPTSDISQTSSSAIMINYPAMAALQNGGADILSYEL